MSRAGVSNLHYAVMTSDTVAGAGIQCARKRCRMLYHR